MKNTEPAKLMTASESFRKLLLAHVEGDAEARLTRCVASSPALYRP
jgi:hypothetical protein